MLLKNKELITRLQKRITDQLAFINGELEGIPTDSLNFRPGKGKWSALECIEHLNLVFELYLPRISKQLKKSRLKFSDSYSTGFFGDRMVSSMEPKGGEIIYPMKTFRSLKPERSQGNKKIVIAQFQEHMELLNIQMEKSEKIDLGSIRIKSAIGIVFRFKLGDCYRFLLAHNERHLLQCRKALKVLATHQ